MEALAEYPTKPPPGVPAVQRRNGMWRCRACADLHHASCVGAVRDAHPTQRLWVCYCCGVHKIRCLDCGVTDDIDPGHWKCVDPAICAGRLALRRANSPLWNMLQQCKVAGVNARRRKREQTARIWRNVPADEEDKLEQDRKAGIPKRGATGICGCCGEPTKGGEFLPGHDAKLKSRLRKAAKVGGPEGAQAEAELETRGW